MTAEQDTKTRQKFLDLYAELNEEGRSETQRRESAKQLRELAHRWGVLKRLTGSPSTTIASKDDIVAIRRRPFLGSSVGVAR